MRKFKKDRALRTTHYYYAYFFPGRDVPFCQLIENFGKSPNVLYAKYFPEFSIINGQIPAERTLKRSKNARWFSHARNALI